MCRVGILYPRLAQQRRGEAWKNERTEVLITMVVRMERATKERRKKSLLSSAPERYCVSRRLAVREFLTTAVVSSRCVAQSMSVSETCLDSVEKLW